MPDSSFHLRASEKSTAAKAALIAALAISIHMIWFTCNHSCQLIFWNSWAMVWLPVALGYAIDLTVFKKLSIIQMMGVFFLANAICISIAHLLGEDEIFLFYLFIFFPAQLLLIGVVEIFLRFVRRG